MLYFKDIPLHLKNMLIHVWLLPFWYVSLYLFSPTIYNNQEIVLICSICICLTLSSSILTIILGKLLEFKENTSLFDIENVLGGFVIQLSLMSILIFFSYLFYILTGIIFRFYGFVVFYFSFVILLFVFIYILGRNNQNKLNNSPKK